MTDQRFEHDLKTVLREIAGREAPMSLRNRVADVIDGAPVSRRLWFAPPMKLSLAAVGAVAVVVLAYLGGAGRSRRTHAVAVSRAVGERLGDSVEPTPSAPSRQPRPSRPRSRRLASPPGPDSSGRWVSPSRAGGWHFNDIVPWRGGFAALATPARPPATHPTSPLSPAFFTSTDGAALDACAGGRADRCEP